MARTLPTTIIEAVNAATTDEAFLVLLELSHSAFTTQRVVNNTQDIVSNGETFRKFPFAMVAPPDTDEFQPRIQVVAMDVVSELVTDMRAISGSRERAACTISIIAASDPDTALASWDTFEVVSVEYNAEVLRFDLAVESFLAEPYPADNMSPSGFPGLF